MTTDVQMEGGIAFALAAITGLTVFGVAAVLAVNLTTTAEKAVAAQEKCIQHFVYQKKKKSDDDG